MRTRLFLRSVIVLVFAALLILPAVIQAGETHEDATVFQLFSDMETAWNARDADAYIGFFHEDLKLKLGKPGSVKYYSKSEYAKVLPGRMEKFGPFKMVEPEILKMDGDKAKAKVIVRKKTRDYKNVFNLVWEDGRWQIVSNEW